MSGNLSKRQPQPELMDQPDLDSQEHIEALDGLARINFWSRSAHNLWQPIRSLAKEKNKPLRVLDIACGGGDVVIALWQRATNEGIELRMQGCDISPRAVGYANLAAAQVNAPVTFATLDAVKDELPSGYDIVICSLFLHHLSDDDAVALIGKMAKAAKQMVLIQDLMRCRTGLLLASMGTQLLTGSRVVQTDGLLSVKAAFTIEEMHGLARRAGLEGHTISRRFPCRFLLEWKR